MATEHPAKGRRGKTRAGQQAKILTRQADRLAGIAFRANEGREIGIPQRRRDDIGDQHQAVGGGELADRVVAMREPQQQDAAVADH
jgi:hypothetical protein